MSELPVVPRFKRYRGAKLNLRRKADEEAKVAQKIADHINAKIANDPNNIQQIIYGFVAVELGVTAEQVQRALPGGHNGWTFGVDENDRRRLERYKKSAAASL